MLDITTAAAAVVVVFEILIFLSSISVHSLSLFA